MGLKEVLHAQRACPIVGLESVQEFHCPDRDYLPKMYRCSFFDCEGAWGTSHHFARHLVSKRHLSSFLRTKYPDTKKLDEKADPLELVRQWLTENGVSEEEVDFDKVEVIRDEERYWIQADRSGARNQRTSQVSADVDIKVGGCFVFAIQYTITCEF